MTQVLGSLSPIRETWIVLLPPRFSGGPILAILVIWGVSQPLGTLIVSLTACQIIPLIPV